MLIKDVWMLAIKMFTSSRELGSDFVAKALSYDLLTRVSKAKLKPKREQREEPEGQELEQEWQSSGDERGVV